jgi:hypothetical protein
MEKQDKIIYTILGLGVAYFAFQFIFRKANYTSECEKELAGQKFESEIAKKEAILKCIMKKKMK